MIKAMRQGDKTHKGVLVPDQEWLPPRSTMTEEETVRLFPGALCKYDRDKGSDREQETDSTGCILISSELVEDSFCCDVELPY